MLTPLSPTKIRPYPTADNILAISEDKEKPILMRSTNYAETTSSSCADYVYPPPPPAILYKV